MVIICSGNGWLHFCPQADGDNLLFELRRINFCEFQIKMQWFSLKKMYLKL